MIDVIIPVYNGRRHLKRAVEAALDCADARVILVDDGSTDGTADLCDALAQNDRVTAIHRQNGGASAARNTGLNAATGEFVTFLDADDALIPGSLELLAAHMIGVDAMQGSVVRKSARIPKITQLRAMSADLALEEALLDATRHLHCHGWLFRRTLLTERFNESLTLGEDGEWLLRTLKHAGYAGFLDCPCYLYTVRRDSTLHAGYNVAERYLTTLKAAAPALDGLNRPQSAAHYRLTHLLLTLTHGVFRERGIVRSIIRCKRICREEPYATAFATADLRGHAPRLIVLRQLKKGRAGLAYMAVKLRQVYNALYR